MKKQTSYILMVIGAALFLLGSYSANFMMSGEMHMMEGRPGMGPRRHAWGMENQQSMHNAPNQMMNTLVTAGYLRFGGAVLFLLGAGALLLRKK
jgi:hypothetical protein